MVSNILQNGKIIKTDFLGSSIFIFQQEVHNILSKKKKKEDEGEDKKKLATEIKII